MPIIPKQLIPESLFYSTYTVGEGKYSDEKPIAGGKLDIWRFRSGEPAWQDSDEVVLKNRRIIIADPTCINGRHSRMLENLHDSGFHLFVLHNEALIEVQPLLSLAEPDNVTFLIKNPISTTSDSKEVQQTEYAITAINGDQEKIKRVAVANKWQIEAYVILDYVETRKLSTHLNQYDIRYPIFTDNMFSMEDLIKIEPDEFRQILMCLKNITGLYFNTIDDYTISYAKTIIKIFPINSIKIHSHSEIELTLIEELFAPNQLEHFQYYGDKFNISVSERFVARYPNLKTASLTEYNCTVGDDGTITSPILKLHALQKLQISRLHLYTNSFANFILPHLTSIDFIVCTTDIGTTDVMVPASFSRLKKLNLINSDIPLVIFEVAAAELVTLKIKSTRQKIKSIPFLKLRHLSIIRNINNEEQQDAADSFLQCSYPVIHNLQLYDSEREYGFRESALIDEFSKTNKSIEIVNETYRYFDETGNICFPLKNRIAINNYNLRLISGARKAISDELLPSNVGASVIEMVHKFLSNNHITASQINIDLFNKIEIWPDLALLPQIEACIIQSNSLTPNLLAVRLFDIFPNLRSLNLPYHLAIYTGLKLPNLQNLRITFNREHTPQPKDAKKLLQFLENCPNLTSLYLERPPGSKKSFEDFLKILFENVNFNTICPKLRQIELAGFSHQLIKYITDSKANIISISIIQAKIQEKNITDFININKVPLVRLYITTTKISPTLEHPILSSMLKQPHFLTVQLQQVKKSPYIENIIKSRKKNMRTAFSYLDHLDKTRKLRDTPVSDFISSTEFDIDDGTALTNEVKENFPGEDFTNIRLRRDGCYNFNPNEFSLKVISPSKKNLRKLAVPRISDTNHEMKLDLLSRARTLSVPKKSKNQLLPIHGLILNEKVISIHASAEQISLIHDSQQDLYFLKPLTDEAQDIIFSTKPTPVETLDTESKFNPADIHSRYKKDIERVAATCKMKHGMIFYRKKNILQLHHPLKDEYEMNDQIPNTHSRYILLYGIAAFLNTFTRKPTPFTADQDFTNMDKANRLIATQTGSCVDRALILTAAAYTLGIDAQSSANDIHQMCEIGGPSPLSWTHIELGGYDTDVQIQRKSEISLDVDIFSTLSSFFSSLVRTDTSSSSTSLSSMPAVKMKFSTWWEAQSQKPFKRPMAIYFNSEKDLEAFYACMLRYLNTKGSACHYLPKLKNLPSYNYKKDKEQYSQILGNATKHYLRDNAHGIFLANFSDPLPGCTSLVDEVGTFQGIVISANMRRLVLILKSHRAQISQELHSRFYPVIQNIEDIIDLSEDPYDGRVLDALPTNRENTVDILCGNSPRDIFLGKPYFDNNRMVIKPSPLVKNLDLIESKDMREKKSKAEDKILALYGFTNDHEHRIKLIELINNNRNPITDDSISFNGNVKFYITPHVLFNDNYKIFNILNINQIEWHLPLSKANLQSYFITHKIDEHGAMIDSPGYLELFSGKLLLIVVIDHLSDKEWAQLLDVAAQYKTNLGIINPNQFPLPAPMQKQPREEKFAVAPFLPIIDSFSIAPTLPVFSIALTTDIEKTLQSMYPRDAERPPVYCLSSQHTSGDVGLVIQSTELNKFQFVLGDLVKTLLSGHPAIIAIDGPLSKDLETWLATLLQTEPFLIVNGERCKVSGKLMIVTTHMATFSYTSNRFKISDALLASTPSIPSLPSAIFHVINGSIGVGKSHYIKACTKERKIHTDIASWIEDKTENTALIIDHGHKKGKNLLAPFYGLCVLPSNPTLLFEGRLISVPRDKTIFIEYNSNAVEDKIHYHYFQRKLCLKEIHQPTDEQLITTAIIPILKDAVIEYKTHGKAISDRMLFHYHHFQIKAQLSQRNVANMAYRLKELFSKIPPLYELNEYIDIAVYDEISGLLSETDRDQFKRDYLSLYYNEIKLRLCHAIEWASTREFVVNNSALNLARQIEILLKKCDDRLGPFGLLIQGDSGIGKTEGVKAYLTAKNIPFIHIQVTDKQLVQLELNRALSTNQLIIIDELDALPIMGIVREFLDNGGIMIGIFNGGCSYPNRQMLDDDLINECMFMLMEYPEPQELKHVLVTKYVESAIADLIKRNIEPVLIEKIKINLTSLAESLIKDHIETRLKIKDDALRPNPRVLYREAQEAIEKALLQGELSTNNRMFRFFTPPPSSSSLPVTSTTGSSSTNIRKRHFTDTT
jgi:hypothetical protein